MQIDGGEGVLMIIKNYTGDILNFETATELLHDSGVKVTTVVIDDDVAVKDSLYTAGRRGVANTALIETRRRSGGAWRLTGRLCGTGA